MKPLPHCVQIMLFLSLGYGSAELRAAEQPNDAFAQRLEITNHFIRIMADLSEATSEPGEPLPAPQAESTLWWKYRAPEAGMLNLAVNPGVAGVEPQLTLFEGSTLESLQIVPPISSQHYVVNADQEYAIQIACKATNSGLALLDLR